MELWLDDIRDPKEHGKPESVWVKTAQAAIDIIHGGEVSFISFDHDLGTELDGHDVATEIERLVFEGKISMPRWAVHSANPVGEAEIVAAMKSAERFSQKKPRNKPEDAAPSSFKAPMRIHSTHRPLPSSMDAEKAVLCSILLSPKENLTLAVERIDRNHFHHPAHGTIYAVMEDLWKALKPIDMVTVTQALADRKQLDQVGGPVALADLQTFLPTAALAEHYLDILREKYLLRRMIGVCTSSVTRCYEEQDDAKNLIDDVEREILAVGEDRFRGEISGLPDHVNTAIDTIEKLYKNKGQLTGVPTGFKQLDKITSGLQPANMIVIAARPSMGKTALAMNIAEHAAVAHAIPVGVFSMEMSTSEIVLRLLCSRARVNLQSIRNGFLGKAETANLVKASTELRRGNMYIDDTGRLSILELRAKARRLMDRHKLGLIVIDYLQLMRAPSKRGPENRQVEMAEVSAGIKSLAKELAIPIIVLAQLNRESEKREGGKPRISELRESGAIEQDADIVALLVRSAYYAKDKNEGAENNGEAELIIAKHRNGPTEDIPLNFIPQFTRFESRDTSHKEAE